MIKPEQVPDAAMNALLQALRLRKGGKEAIAAAINAWPGMTWACRGAGTPPHLLFLPLPQEASDD